MAITEFKETRGRSGTNSATLSDSSGKGARKYTSVYYVYTDAIHETADILAYPLTPQRFQQHPYNSHARCESVTATQNARNPFRWKVTANWSSETPDKTNPESYPIEYRYSHRSEQRPLQFDAEDAAKAVTSTAGEPFEQPVMTDVAILVVEATFYELAFDSANYFEWVNTVNETQYFNKGFDTFDKYTARCADIRGEPIFKKGDDPDDPEFQLYRTTFVVEVDYGIKKDDGTWSGWICRQLDHGSYFLDGGEKKKFETVEGHGRIGLLNGVDGGALVGDDPAFIEFNRYRLQDFNAFPV